MHIADIHGHIHEKRKRAQQRELKYLAWSAVFMITVLAMLLWA